MSKKLIVAHTPDADDAFMFYGMVSGKSTTNFEVDQVIEDIETLNKRAFDGDIDVTALSAHAYAFLHDKYRIISTGMSVGDGYGPVVVAKTDMEVEGKRIGVPGKYTTANLLLKLAIDDFRPVEMRFDEIIPAVEAGDVDAGLLIHEGQITYPDHGLTKILDLWDFWYEKTKLPLPLGLNAIKRDIPAETQNEFAIALRESVDYALDNVEEAMQHAMKYSRGADRDLVEKFALMYVNTYTREIPKEGVKGLETLYKMGEERGFFEKLPPLDILFA